MKENFSKNNQFALQDLASKFEITDFEIGYAPIDSLTPEEVEKLSSLKFDLREQEAEIYKNPESDVVAEFEFSYNPKSIYLEVWRTLWIEIDQMAAPEMTTEHGFDPANQGVTWDLVEALPVSNPGEIDIFEQPAKPDISLLQKAMLAACIEVKELTQTTDYAHWITGDESTLHPGIWDTETPFVHLLSDHAGNDSSRTSPPSRDVNIRNAAFWTVHAIGAYEGIKNKDGKTLLGLACPNPDVFFIYDESMRKNPTHTNTQPLDVMTQIVVLHEVLHFFGLDHDDGGVMAVVQRTLPDGSVEHHSGDLRNTQSQFLLPAQVRKVQQMHGYIG